MAFLKYFVILIALCIFVSTNAGTTELEDAPRPIRDRFRIIQNNINEERVSEEVTDFLAYGCEKMVVIRNRAQEEFKLLCSSRHDSPKPTVIQTGNAYAFTFRPQRNGNSKYWCTVEYKQQFARFDVYNEDMSYMCPREIDEVYQYTVHHDGVYVNKKGDNSEKIKSLMKGHNKFILWEEFVNGETNGFLVGGLVDGGMCYDIPEQFNDKTAAVTTCSNHCIKLYEHYGCRGKTQILQANDNCVDTGLVSDLDGKLSAIQGC